MKLDNVQLGNFINRIRLHRDNMGKYRTQIENLRDRLKTKIKDDTSTGMKVTRFLIAGSWKKHTILRPKGEHPVDVDLVLFVDGDDSLKSDINKLHDYVVKYLLEIYPTKDVGDVEAEGKTKAIKIKFKSTGLEVDIVPVVPDTPSTYMWQPERGGGGRFITSIDKQLDVALQSRKQNASYTSIVRALKWWRNRQGLKPGLTSFTIELIASHLDDTYGRETSIEEGIIRFFQFVSGRSFPVITFPTAINKVPSFTNPVFIADPTNNENNAASKLGNSEWDTVVKAADVAFEALSIAQSCTTMGATTDEWTEVFGPSFNIEEN
ncbi:MAG: CBASS oligonucleotide cyclase [Janthinobacterium lividum]